MSYTNDPQNLTPDEVREAVRENYGRVAEAESSVGCCGTTASCCAPEQSSVTSADQISSALGYTSDELKTAPEGSNLGLGCGNPQAIASLKSGEVVLDLGSGAGFDSFLAARAVGQDGKVIGVDMTPEMIKKARNNAAKSEFGNVEFRLGEIENLPVADGMIDAIISNCVINLSPEKQSVFSEAFRVLKPGGRLAISDVVATAELPKSMRSDLSLYAGCVSGAAAIDELEAILAAAGFVNVRIASKDESREFIREWAPGGKIEDYVVSATIEAIKPLR